MLCAFASMPIMTISNKGCNFQCCRTEKSFGTCYYRWLKCMPLLGFIFISIFWPIFYVFVGLRSLIFIITFNGVGKKMNCCFSCVSYVSVRFILIRSLSFSLASNANLAESLNTQNANATQNVRSAEPHPHRMHSDRVLRYRLKQLRKFNGSLA